MITSGIKMVARGKKWYLGEKNDYFRDKNGTTERKMITSGRKMVARGEKKNIYILYLRGRLCGNANLSIYKIQFVNICVCSHRVRIHICKLDMKL